MIRYRALVTFGPWRRGDEFESSDPWHAMLGEHGRLLEVLEAGESVKLDDSDADEQPERAYPL